MHRISRWVLMLGVILGLVTPVWADLLPQGRYVYESVPQDVEFELRIPSGRLGKPVEIPFAAATLSGAGPAVEGRIWGIPADGPWTVTFTDSFGNAGRGTVVFKPGLLFLTLKLDRAEEPRCARFYGSIRLIREG